MDFPVALLHASTNSLTDTPRPVPTLKVAGGLETKAKLSTCASTRSVTCTKSRTQVPSRVGCVVPEIAGYVFSLHFRLQKALYPLIHM